VQVDYGGGVPPVGEDVRLEALAVLSDSLAWTMPPARWTRIAALVEALAAALAKGDAPAVESATIDLEQLSPRRIPKIGDKDEPIPKALRGTVVHLVHSLGGDPKDASRSRGAKATGKTDTEKESSSQ
jgi:hypothetical protein